MLRPRRGPLAPAGTTLLVALCMVVVACSGGKKPATTPAEGSEPVAAAVADGAAAVGEPVEPEPAAVEEAGVEQPAEPAPEATTVLPATEPRAEAGSEPPPLLAAPEEPTRPPTQITLDRPRESTGLLPAPQDDGNPPSQYDPEDATLTVITERRPAKGEPADLWTAAQRERERREGAGEVDIVLTDRNLAEMAARGEITVAAPDEESVGETVGEPTGEDSGGSELEPETPDAPLEKLAEDEAYWRSGALRIRTEMAEAAARIGDLETEAFQLRQRFYAEDDPFYRDGQIKPSWDRTLEELDDTREAVLEKREELERFLDAGRRAGALPGWLREGIELEPEIEIVEEGPIYEPGEPVVVEQDGKYDG